jgi:hypothetical protein
VTHSLKTLEWSGAYLSIHFSGRGAVRVSRLDVELTADPVRSSLFFHPRVLSGDTRPVDAQTAVSQVR